MGGVNLVAGFRPELWREVVPDDAPAGVAGFAEPLVGQDGFVMPATQHDAVLWLSGSSYDVIFDVSRMAIRELAGLVAVAEETSSWSYQHDRDLTGFIDGTENPSLIDAQEVSVIGDGKLGLYHVLRAGGSLDSEMFPESMAIRSFPDARAYATLLCDRHIDQIIHYDTYDASRNTNEGAMIDALEKRLIEALKSVDAHEHLVTVSATLQVAPL